MASFMKDLSSELNKSKFVEDFLEIFVRNGFGALPKREIELTLIELLIQHAPNTVGDNPAVYNLARNLRLSPRRLQSLMDEIAYRDVTKNDDWCREQLTLALKSAEKIDRDGAIQFQIDDGLVRDYAVAQVRAGYGIVDHSFNSAVIKLSGEKFAALAIELMDKSDQEKLLTEVEKAKREAQQDNRKTKGPIRLFVDAFASEAGKTAGKKTVDLGFAILTGGLSEAKDLVKALLSGEE